MKNILALIIGIALGAGGLWFWSHHAAAHEKEDASVHVEEPQKEDGAFHMTKAQQAAAGIKTDPPMPARLPTLVRAYGRVLDPAILIATRYELEAARAASDASAREFERTKNLSTQNQNASARALETADAAVKRDRAQLSHAQAKLQSLMGPSAAKWIESPELMDALAAGKSALLRIETPAGPLKVEPGKFKFGTLADESNLFEAEVLGPAPQADGATQGNAFLALARTNFMPANLAIFAWLEVGGGEKDGFIVPETAVLQDGSESVAMVQAGEETFAKREVEVDRRTEKGLFVTGGLSATNQIVVHGAHQILSIKKAEAAE